MLKPIFKNINRKRDVVEEDSILNKIQEEARQKATEKSMEQGIEVNKKTLKETLFGGG